MYARIIYICIIYIIICTRVWQQRIVLKIAWFFLISGTRSLSFRAIVVQHDSKTSTTHSYGWEKGTNDWKLHIQIQRFNHLSDWCKKDFLKFSCVVYFWISLRAIIKLTNTLVCHIENFVKKKKNKFLRIPNFKNYERQSRGCASRVLRPD